MYFLRIYELDFYLDLMHQHNLKAKLPAAGRNISLHFTVNYCPGHKYVILT